METYDHGPLRGVLAALQPDTIEPVRLHIALLLAGQPINQNWIAASSGKGDAPDPDADLFAMQSKLAAAA